MSIMSCCFFFFFFFQAEDGIRDAQESRGLGDVYKRQVSTQSTGTQMGTSCSKDTTKTPTTPTSPAPANYASLSTKQLKALCAERGIDTLRCLEKPDLIKCIEISERKAAAKPTPAAKDAAKLRLSLIHI
eukprot:TRINITY_DN5520_c0_g1_i3.p1 TRINITY_DN5520_c0_g1~~TRINITY_DN5520_c0_g1_i3.p1  ORF type:complete len:130 (-),score=47.39 TRINITY_DN5520_c0_g1_i3:152-541(-)